MQCFIGVLTYLIRVLTKMREDSIEFAKNWHQKRFDALEEQHSAMWRDYEHKQHRLKDVYEMCCARNTDRRNQKHDQIIAKQAKINAKLANLPALDK